MQFSPSDDRAGAASHPRLLDHLTDAVRSERLHYGSSCALDWVRLLDDRALARLADFDEAVAHCGHVEREAIEHDALSVVLVLGLMEAGDVESFSIPVETIVVDLQVLSLIAALVRLERGRAIAIVEPIRISDSDQGEIVLSLSERMRRAMSAPLN